jgi:hypothetical protein
MNKSIPPANAEAFIKYRRRPRILAPCLHQYSIHYTRNELTARRFSVHNRHLSYWRAASLFLSP